MSVVTLCTAAIHGRARAGTAPLGAATGAAACTGMAGVRGAGLASRTALVVSGSMTGRSGSKRESFDGNWLASRPVELLTTAPVPSPAFATVALMAL